MSLVVSVRQQMYSQHTAPRVACAAGTLQPAGDDGWCLKGFSPYFLPLSGKTQFIASHSAGLRCSGSCKEWWQAGQSGAGRGHPVCPDSQGGSGLGDLCLRSLLIQAPGSADGKMTKGPIFSTGVFQPCTQPASAVRENANRPPWLPELLQGGTGCCPSPAYVTPCIAFKWSPFCLLNKNDTALLIAY